ncbi:MAG TPA: Rha family transcriptional regulator [Polaromonas sp.]|nr:Rha family transcriptional regulator [Polaromonas sp.]
MSSREIAELTGKRHDNVMADIRNMLEELLNSPEFSGQHDEKAWGNIHGTYKDKTGRTLACVNLPKDLTITLISGYNVTMRHRIVTRWQELEAAPQAVALPQNFGEALRVAAENWERAQVAEQALALAAPIGCQRMNWPVDGWGIRRSYTQRSPPLWPKPA